MKKPLNYYGFAFDKPEKGFNKKYLKSKKGIKEIKKIKKYNKKHLKRLKKHGFDDTELWNLDVTISKFVLVRLKRFRQTSIGYPSNLTEKKWKKILKKMIYSFEFHLNEDLNKYDKFTKKDNKKIEKGFILFAKYLTNLWN